MGNERRTQPKSPDNRYVDILGSGDFDISGVPMKPESTGGPFTYKFRRELLVEDEDREPGSEDKAHIERVKAHTERIQAELKKRKKYSKFCYACKPKKVKSKGLGLCSKHYHRLKKYGSPYMVSVRLPGKGCKYKIVDERTYKKRGNKKKR